MILAEDGREGSRHVTEAVSSPWGQSGRRAVVIVCAGGPVERVGHAL